MRFSCIVAALPLACLFAGAAVAQEGDAAAGETVFKKCAICHVVDKDTNKVRPSLLGVFGRTAGTHADFKYSTAMVDAGKAGLVWDATTLRDYLHNPKAKVKGTKMVFPGLKDDADIANLLAYLKQYSPQ